MAFATPTQLCEDPKGASPYEVELSETVATVINNKGGVVEVLFRQKSGSAVFVSEDGRAVARSVGKSEFKVERFAEPAVATTYSCME